MKSKDKVVDDLLAKQTEWYDCFVIRIVSDESNLEGAKESSNH